LSLDQGTASSRAILYDQNGNITATAQKEFRQIYPKAGWVEHDPMEIWESQSGVISEILATSAITGEEIAAIGITNQRETTVVWERQTGKHRTGHRCLFFRNQGKIAYQTRDVWELMRSECGK